MFNIPFNIHIPSINNLVWKTDGILKKVMIILTHSQTLLFLFEFACLKYLFLPMQTVTSHSHWQVWLLFLYVQVFLPRELKDFVTHKITWSKFNASLYNTCTPSASLIRTSVCIIKLTGFIVWSSDHLWDLQNCLKERGVHWLHPDDKVSRLQNLDLSSSELLVQAEDLVPSTFCHLFPSAKLSHLQNCFNCCLKNSTKL